MLRALVLSFNGKRDIFTLKLLNCLLLVILKHFQRYLRYFVFIHTYRKGLITNLKKGSLSRDHVPLVSLRDWLMTECFFPFSPHDSPHNTMTTNTMRATENRLYGINKIVATVLSFCWFLFFNFSHV